MSDRRLESAYVHAMKLAMVGVAVMGCATPYQPTGVRGGFTENQIAPGAFAINVQVNAYTTMSTAVAYAYRRAGELCPNGFNIVDSSKSQRDNYTVTEGSISNAPKSDVALIVQCKASTVETLARQESESQSRPTTWWCSHFDKTDDGPRLSTCARTPGQCRRFREKMSKAGYGSSDCEERSSVACYTFRDKDGDSIDDCSTSTAACQVQLEHRKSTSGDITSECETK